MASAAIYDAMVTYLEAATISIVNAEQTGLLVAGSVTVSRSPRRATRAQAPFPVSVEIVPAGPWPSRTIGVGVEELDAVFELKIEVRKKSLPSGKTQIDVVEDVARALIRAWRNTAGLSITATGATFRRSTAMLVSLDETPDTVETCRGVVRASFTWTEAQV